MKVNRPGTAVLRGLCIFLGMTFLACTACISLYDTRLASAGYIETDYPAPQPPQNLPPKLDSRLRPRDYTAETPAGLVSYWHFDEGSGGQAQDLISGNNGAIFGGASWTDGIAGNALSLDGNDDYVLVPHR